MKAITLQAAGGVEQLAITDLPVPSIKDDEVLVQVRAISINPVDTKVRRRQALIQLVLQLEDHDSPKILGWDIAGIVVATGAAVTAFKKGDAVFGMVNFPGHGKAYTEYVAAPANHLAPKPTNISYEEAAAATLAALTAWQALVSYGGTKAGDKVLIHAAAGGVGHYAVQIARQLGAHVIGTSSAKHKDLVLQLGAHEHIDYQQTRFESLVADADLVVDSIETTGHLERSLQAVKPGGALISLNLLFDKNLDIAMKARTKGVFTHRMEVRSDGSAMQQIAAWLEQGKLRSHIAYRFPFEEMAAAHLQLESGRTAGKIVLTL
ncbi:NADPH:quinone reductase-like Zn-dependent oxidoreductase [Chitinophaga dinghuensis]|uniref:NADPH:quinone reductase-like Zn-dependent oxidoreductase n=1 Tax=Chitinophaga dinghuensis TaxID=1539050 RepID=A0A327W257_9BACT|nr:NADP-dependent oxidoreductase [Chitinophaga dinghuensis]RAJ78998.1 NADPH:quinone reductase-like Zn-dependent oxidoreductase [Chitinophaga dinghuensis]